MTTEEMIQALEALLETLRAKPVSTTPEPDTWPTHELIVATRGGPVNRRGLFARWQTDTDYVDIAGATSDDVYDLATLTPDTLTDVVPVKPVPVAELDALRACIKALGYGTQGGTRGMPDSLLDTALRLLEATDALGVDL